MGIWIGRSGSLAAAKKHSTKQGNKSVFALIKKVRNLSLPIDIQIDLFKKTVKPVLLYGCEIWGFGNIDMIERIQLKYFKYIFNVKNYLIVYGIWRTSTLPLSVGIQTCLICFWSKLIVNHDNNKLLSVIYNIVYELNSAKVIKSKWVYNIKELLCSLGCSVIWYNQRFLNTKWLVNASKQNLKTSLYKNGLQIWK